MEHVNKFVHKIVPVDLQNCDLKNVETQQMCQPQSHIYSLKWTKKRTLHGPTESPEIFGPEL